MGNLADHQRIGAESVHISDCYVWAEIYYLNSTSDYREYLPQNGADGPRSISHDNWVPLEFSERAPGRGARIRRPRKSSGLQAICKVTRAAASGMLTHQRPASGLSGGNRT